MHHAHLESLMKMLSEMRKRIDPEDLFASSNADTAAVPLISLYIRTPLSTSLIESDLGFADFSRIKMLRVILCFCLVRYFERRLDCKTVVYDTKPSFGTNLRGSCQKELLACDTQPTQAELLGGLHCYAL